MATLQGQQVQPGILRNLIHNISSIIVLYNVTKNYINFLVWIEMLNLSGRKIMTSTSVLESDPQCGYYNQNDTLKQRGFRYVIVLVKTQVQLHRQYNVFFVVLS